MAGELRDGSDSHALIMTDHYCRRKPEIFGKLPRIPGPSCGDEVHRDLKPANIMGHDFRRGLSDGLGFGEGTGERGV
jgi:hypothetical protein